jgi:hypothetical protein
MMMKRLLFLQFTLLAHASAWSQIDYVMHPQIIAPQQSEIKIDWILSSPKNCLIDFNHFVVFNNAIDDQLYGSKVSVELYKNNSLVKRFLFSTGDGIYNRIYLNTPIKIKKGESLYFIFKLQSVDFNEKYVFNIFQEKRDKIDLQKKEITIATAKPFIQVKVEPTRKEPKQKAGGAYLKEKRKERFNKTMIVIGEIISFGL